MSLILRLIGRERALFDQDIIDHECELKNIVTSSTFLVIGGAGSIGQTVTKEIFKCHPKKLHVVDISENNMVELVRDIRSSLGYIESDFKTFALDIGSVEYDAFIQPDGASKRIMEMFLIRRSLHAMKQTPRFLQCQDVKAQGNGDPLGSR